MHEKKLDAFIYASRCEVVALGKNDGLDRYTTYWIMKSIIRLDHYRRSGTDELSYVKKTSLSND